MAFKLRKLSHALGAEACDIDGAAPMGEAVFGENVRRFGGMTEKGSLPLIKYLNAHAAEPVFACRD